MKKFKKIIAMGCAAVMAMSAMSIGAFADSDTITTNIVSSDSNAIPYVVSTKLLNEVTDEHYIFDAEHNVQLSLNVCSDEYDDVSIELTPVEADTKAINTTETNDSYIFTNLQPGCGYVMTVTTTNDDICTRYTSDFSVYPILKTNSDAVSFITSDIAVTTYDKNAELSDVTNSEYEAISKHVDDLLAEDDIVPYSYVNKGSLIDGGSTKYAMLSSSSSMHRYTAKNKYKYVNYCLDMRAYSGDGTFLLDIQDEDGNSIAQTLRVPQNTINSRDNIYLTVGTTTYLYISGVSGALTTPYNYGVKFRSHVSRE